jgi:hypothetical protein
VSLFGRYVAKQAQRGYRSGVNGYRPRVEQVLLLEGAEWKRGAFVTADHAAAACSGTLKRSEILAMGVSVGTYLLIVLLQVVIRWILTSLQFPIIGNLEDPRDSFLYVLALMFSESAVESRGFGEDVEALPFFLLPWIWHSLITNSNILLPAIAFQLPLEMRTLEVQFRIFAG